MSITSAEYRLNKILKTLEMVHGIELNLDTTTDSIQEAYTTYSKKRSDMIQESSFNGHVYSPEYTEALLICEALRIHLKEIAPNRRIRRRRK